MATPAHVRERERPSNRRECDALAFCLPLRARTPSVSCTLRGMRPLVGALLGLAASSVFGVACGSFSSTGTSSEADASVADASNDGSAGRDGDAPQDGAVLTDGGPPDGRTSDADSGESLDAGPADPLTLVGPGKACTAESAFSKAYVLSGFGLNVVSLSMDDEELLAVVVNGTAGNFGNPVTFYQRSSRSNSFAKVSFTRLGNVLAMKTTSVGLSPNGGSLIFALEGEKAGIGKVALDWDHENVRPRERDIRQPRWLLRPPAVHKYWRVRNAALDLQRRGRRCATRHQRPDRQRRADQRSQRERGISLRPDRVLLAEHDGPRESRARACHFELIRRFMDLSLDGDAHGVRGGCSEPTPIVAER